MNIENLSHRLLCAGTAVLFFVSLGCSSQSSSTSPVDAGKDGGVRDAAKESGSEASSPDASLSVGCVDRAGRPAIIFALVPDDGGVRNAFNCTDYVTLTGGGAFDPTLTTAGGPFSLALNKLNDLGDNPWPSPSPLLALLAHDALIVDPSKPFSPTSYLEIEIATYGETPVTHTTCGGRWPGDDAIDKTLSFLVKRQLTGLSDSVNAATKPPAMTFPYLAPPN